MKRFLLVLALLALAVAGAGFAAWSWAQGALGAPTAFGVPGEERLFEVRSGESVRAICARATSRSERARSSSDAETAFL